MALAADPSGLPSPDDASGEQAPLGLEVLLEKGTHTGSYPGRVLNNARYHGRPAASRERSKLEP